MVEFASMKDDLYRRDFTVNAMAVKINKKDSGFLLDFFEGRKDLSDKVIKVLHDKSFIDDPTRIFRAVRFEQRLGFRIEKHTEYLIKHAVKRNMFHHTENQRIREELILMLKERHPEKAVLRMSKLHELRFIHPDLVLKRSIPSMFENLRKCRSWYEKYSRNLKNLDTWVMNFIPMLEGLDIVQLEDILKKFAFTRNESMKLRFYKEYTTDIIKALSARRNLLPGEIYDILSRAYPEVIIFIMARTRSVNTLKRIKEFLKHYDGVNLKVKGHDIKKQGISPGAEYQEILRKILHKKLEGKLPRKSHEIGYLKELTEKYKGE